MSIGVSENLLEERRRLGADRWDEMWDGVLHMVPAPSGAHQIFCHRLGRALGPSSDQRGLVDSHETALYRPGASGSDYRIPDLVYTRPDCRTDRGVEGRAELAVEIRSPDDETYAKFGFYAEMGVQELLMVDPTTCEADMFVLRDGRLVAGPLRSESLGVDFATHLTDAGPVLRVTGPQGTTDVHG